MTPIPNFQFIKLTLVDMDTMKKSWINNDPNFDGSAVEQKVKILGTVWVRKSNIRSFWPIALLKDTMIEFDGRISKHTHYTTITFYDKDTPVYKVLETPQQISEQLVTYES